MSRENLGWGAPRIHSELMKLGIKISESSVAKYMIRSPKPPSQTWKTFLWVANSKLGQNPSFSSVVLRSVVKGAFVVFGNNTISLHILRGVLAAAAIYGSLATMSRTIWPSIILLPTAVYLMKG